MFAHNIDAKSSTLTVRLPTEMRDKLGQLAERELEIVAAIERGVEDMKAGRVVPQEDAMGRVRATIERAAK